MATCERCDGIGRICDECGEPAHPDITKDQCWLCYNKSLSDKGDN